MASINPTWLITFLTQVTAGGLLAFFGGENKAFGIALLGSAFGQALTAQSKAIKE